ncbi:uncharacterized protein LOC113865615 [Abrus precatorius]|uniref:Uncharacterized protein LOC113865615 n=1 Tax=Abrus precatorius TaxID=3816 RepID=A0A8B8LMN0_ABRPR|nr:uncharacterized protein LOC113865615 [Abrus precatorius]
MAPNCAYLSNPYHRCTQACSQNINQTKPHANPRKGSGYGRSVTDGQLGKKVNEQRRTYSGCPKASNPYHQCDENCYKRLSDSGATPPLKLDRKKKVGSKPEPPVLDSVPASKVGAIYLSDGSSPVSKKKVETKNDERVPCEHKSGQLHVPNVKPVYHKDQIQDDSEPVGNPMQTNHQDKIASNKVVPITHVDDDTVEGLTASAGGSIDSSLSAVPRGNERSDEGETESVISEPRIQVGGYHIKESFSSILQSILDKYGDIGASCRLESVVMRSYYVGCVCFVVQELQSESVMQISKSKVKELLAILKDAESAQLRVAWLRSVLDEIAENIELINQHQDVEVEKANSAHEVESLREKLESELEALAQKKQEIANIKTRIPEIRDRLGELELKSSELNKGTLSTKSKVDNLHIKSLIDELL